MAEAESVRAQAEGVAWEEVCEGGCSCLCRARAASEGLLFPKETKNESFQ